MVRLNNEARWAWLLSSGVYTREFIDRLTINGQAQQRSPLGLVAELGRLRPRVHVAPANKLVPHLSPFTVENHVSNIIVKLGVSTRIEAATLAVQQKLM
jgi:hypothetical protein